MGGTTLPYREGLFWPKLILPRAVTSQLPNPLTTCQLVPVNSPGQVVLCLVAQHERLALPQAPGAPLHTDPPAAALALASSSTKRHLNHGTATAGGSCRCHPSVCGRVTGEQPPPQLKNQSLLVGGPQLLWVPIGTLVRSPLLTPGTDRDGSSGAAPAPSVVSAPAMTLWKKKGGNEENRVRTGLRSGTA